MRQRDLLKRLLLMTGISVLAFMLLGADYPENDVCPDRSGEVASGLFCDFVQEERGAFETAVRNDPLWFLQCVSR